eukprot:2596765-Amphidinium_carterae.2
MLWTGTQAKQCPSRLSELSQDDGDLHVLEDELAGRVFMRVCRVHRPLISVGFEKDATTGADASYHIMHSTRLLGLEFLSSGSDERATLSLVLGDGV